MNVNEPVFKPSKGGRVGVLEQCKLPLMGPPKSKSGGRSSTSRTSELPWGKSHESIVLNSSSNRRSTSSRSTDEHEEERIIIAITEGRGEARCEVGIAAIRVSSPLVILCQTSDSQSYANTLAKLNIFNPHLILYPASFEMGTGNRLITEIRKRFPNKKLVTSQRKSFNKKNGLDMLYKICIPSSVPLLIMIKNRYYALAAASGLLTYLQDNMYIYYATNSIKLDYQASEGYSIIDLATADRLELVCSNQPAQANKYSSLFGIMNRCLTRVGTRHLRSIILQPLYSDKMINERLDCVEELIRNPEVLLSIQGALPKLSSVDQLLSLSTLVPEDPQRCTNRQLNYLLLLNSVVDMVRPIKEALKNTSQPFFVELREVLGEPEFDEIKNLIRKTIYEGAYSAKGQQADQQRIWAIKPGLNGLLDLVRKTYSERIEDMREYVAKLSQKYDLPLVLANNNKKGYHIIMALNQNQKRHMKTSDLPMEFIQVFRLANSFTMKTAELVNVSTRIEDILTDLFTLSNLMIHHIVAKLKPYAALFYRLVEGISYLDVLQSLAEVSHAHSWVRPKFDEYTEVSFGRHPLLDFLCQKRPVPNPVEACEHYNLHIITGPNGAGKSIFIRQVMLLQIMAQAGCFVPAQTAIFRPADKMFARISNDDDMESNASSFVLEMTEVNYILTTMTDRSLIIVDELCRSTSVEEGTAIAMGICDTLARSQAYTYITTHFIRLTRVADLFFNIKIWQLQTIASGNPLDLKSMKLDFKFSLAPGTTSVRGYGIYMVRGIWPSDCMRIVDELQEEYTKDDQHLRFPKLDERARLMHDLECKVKKLKLRGKLTLASFNKCINEYNGKMQKLGEHSQQFPLNMDGSSFDLNHSIFDAQAQPGDNLSTTEVSKLFLDDFSKSFSDLNGFLTVESEGWQEGEPQFLSPINSQDCSQIPSSRSPLKDNAYLQEVFASRSTTTSYQSINLPPDFRAEVNVSYSVSQCSLDLTGEALGLCNDRGDGLDLKNNNVNDYPEEPGEFVRPQSPKLRPNPPQVPESPFISEFSRPLQDDARKTSTPIVASRDVKNTSFASSASTYTVFQNRLEGTYVTTPKISFKIPENVDLDAVASMVEDLESFADVIERENIICDDENEDRAYEQAVRRANQNRHIFPIVTIIPGPGSISSEEEINYQPHDDGVSLIPVVRNLQEDLLTKTEEPTRFSDDNKPTSEKESLNKECQLNEELVLTEICSRETERNRLETDKPVDDKNDDETGAIIIDDKVANSQNVKENGTLQTIDEDVYETALSSDDLSYSPLVSRSQVWEETVYETDDGRCGHTNQLDKSESKTKGYVDIANVADVVESDTVHNEVSLSNVPSPVPQERSTFFRQNDDDPVEQQENHLSNVDFDESTVKCVTSQNFDGIKTDEILASNIEAVRDNDNEEVLRKSLNEDDIKYPEDITSKNLDGKTNDALCCEVQAVTEVTEKVCVVECNSVSATSLKIDKIEEQYATDKVESIEYNNETENKGCKGQKAKHNLSLDNGLVKTKKIKLVSEADTVSVSDSNKEKTPETTTGVSEASKLRNLDAFTSNSSSAAHKAAETAVPYCNEGELLVTSLSEASNKRNLDKQTAASSSLLKEMSGIAVNTLSQTSSSNSSECQANNRQKKKRKKFCAPLKNKNLMGHSDSSSTNCGALSKSNTDRADGLKSPFVQPWKLSCKAIRQEFFEQDKKFFDISGSSEELTKMWEERLKRGPRPTPKQIKQTTCLATIRRTNERVEVIPAKKKKTRTCGAPKKTIFSTHGSSSVNMNIFSDENAETFDQFIKSKNQDYKLFDFKFRQGEQQAEARSDGKMFDFRQINSTTSEYTQNSQSWTFVRKRSDETNNMQSQASTSTNFPPFLTPCEFTLTPDGFYKQHKDDISNIVSKYT